MTPKEIPYSHCQICQKERLDAGEPQWTTIVRIVHIDTNHVTIELCVCPSCIDRYSFRQIIINRNRGIEENSFRNPMLSNVGQETPQKLR
jgi:hypothetical protein